MYIDLFLYRKLYLKLRHELFTPPSDSVNNFDLLVLTSLS